MSRLTIDDLLGQARATIKRHDPVAAAHAMDRGAVLIDVRCEADRRREGSIEGAIPIPSTVLEWRADPESEWRDERIADLGKTLILMCNDGYASSLAAANLRRIGFLQVGDIIGGFRAWKSAGLPVLGMHDV